jgi:Domain of unknown function (DUF4440)
MIVVASARITQRLPMQSARFVHASVIVCAVAVNDADKSLLRTIWTEGSDVSFVYPRGRLQSWKELESYWDAFLRANFSKRHLEPTNVAIRVEGNVAWVVFDWEFTATRTDGRPTRHRDGKPKCSSGPIVGGGLHTFRFREQRVGPKLRRRGYPKTLAQKQQIRRS